MLLSVTYCLLAVTSVASAAPACPPGKYIFGSYTTCTKPSPAEGWELLKAGNAKFVAGTGTLDEYVAPAVRQGLGGGQSPFAIVLTCSDSRVPPEILFDKGLGEIFVVRVAGNIVNPHELGSIEYALEHLKANLIVVLGHSKCGAVKSTYGAWKNLGQANPGNPDDGIGSLVYSIWPAVNKVVSDAGGKPSSAADQATQVEACVVENIKMVAESMDKLEVNGGKSKIIEEYVAQGKAKIIKAKYDLDTGVVEELPEGH
jgi:carbonic anhydrase